MDQKIRRLRRLAGAAGRRVPVNWPAELRFERLRRPCVVLDLSAAGASIRADGIPLGVTQVKLLLEQGPPITAMLAWRRRERIGLRFAVEQDWLSELGARRFDAAAWVR